jgi:CubicO group peptidase (beta-lactamase class C family)
MALRILLTSIVIAIAGTGANAAASSTVRSYRLVGALVAVGILFACGASKANRSEAADTRIARVEAGLMPISATKEKKGVTAHIRERMRAFGVPGLSIAVIDGGQLAWAKGYGVADSGQSIHPSTQSDIAVVAEP